MLYAASWAPRNAGIFCSTSADGKLCIWDIRTPNNNQPSVLVQVSSTELLCADWSKYDVNLVATGSVDATVSLWDIRNVRIRQQTFFHKKAVRKVKFSPFIAHALASVSYDFTTQIYDLVGHRVDFCLMNHSEFAYGLDWNIHRLGELVDCGWDHMITVTSLIPNAIRPSSSI